MEHESEKTNYTLWISSFLIVCALYGAIVFGFVFFYVPDSRAVGGAEAIMLEFDWQTQAPDVEEISEDIQEETIAENEEIVEPEPEPEPESDPIPEPEPTPIPEPEPEMIEPTPPSDMVEEIKPPEEIKPQEEPKPEPPPAPKTKPKPKTEKIKPKPTVKKAAQAQKAKGPEIIAPQGQKFAAPKTNRNFGNQGKAIAGWKTKVQRKIAAAAHKLRGQAKVKRSLTAAVSFRYDAHGIITSANISRSSGDAAVDGVALRAVRNSSPIPAPPTGQGGSLNVPVRVDPR